MKRYQIEQPKSLGRSFLDLVSGPREPVTIHQDFDEYLSFAFAHDGFVAGGLARKVSQFHNFIERDEGGFAVRVSDVERYRATINNYLNLWAPSQGGGDADVYFSTLEGFNAFNVKLMADVERSSNVNFLAKNDRVVSYRLSNPSRKDANLQAILTLVDIETTLKWFDLASAMIAFDDKYFYTSDDYLAYRDVLHVVNWKDPLETFFRSIKWMRKHDLRSISPETSQRLGSIALDAIVQIQKQGNQVSLNDNNSQYTMSKDRVIEFLKPYLGQLNDDQLLLLMSVMPDKANKTDYDFFPAPIDILMSRMEKSMVTPSSTG